jgi:hypothetical protein
MSAYDQIQATLPTADDNSLAGCLLRQHWDCPEGCECGCHALTPAVTVNVIGYIWQPGIGPCTYTYTMSEREAWDYGVNRDGIRDWLDGHAGDFQEITDFRAFSTTHTPWITVNLDWADPESEDTYHDCMYPSEA